MTKKTFGINETARRAVFSEFQKFRLPADPNHFYIHPCPVPLRGVAHVTDAGRDAVDAGGACNERCRRVRRNRVVLTPQRRRQVREKKRRRRCQTSVVTGESTK